MALPIPFVAPVTRAVFPDSCRSMLSPSKFLKFVIDLHLCARLGKAGVAVKVPSTEKLSLSGTHIRDASIDAELFTLGFFRCSKQALPHWPPNGWHFQSFFESFRSHRPLDRRHPEIGYRTLNSVSPSPRCLVYRRGTIHHYRSSFCPLQLFALSKNFVLRRCNCLKTRA